MENIILRSIYILRQESILPDQLLLEALAFPKQRAGVPIPLMILSSSISVVLPIASEEMRLR